MDVKNTVIPNQCYHVSQKFCKLNKLKKIESIDSLFVF